ncbi:S9 family peptidase [Sphingomonas sp. AOB5]|uniref:alpha/beta hydrolase family protein n=1 Tax=Sphingomonas sp. AOB5 TaxID=3034017 RepID=UPI0023F7E3C8|nr:S9 family peptidase [Sphingomonas sp. AOB5]MDF7775477.1 S9 family peptidase [Sphingomonas sp. AOB5]
MLRHMLALGLCAVAVPALAQPAPVPGPNRIFTGQDLFDLEVATDPQISPDGSIIAYVRRSNDIMSDRARATIWLIDVRSGVQSPLVTGPGSHMSPRWSADGKRLAYISSAEGNGVQLFVRWMDSGATARITNLPDTPGSIAWSPDGTRIAYILPVAGPGLQLGKPLAKPEGAQWAAPLEVIDKVTYRNDGGGYVKPGFDHIFVVSADGGAPRQLTFGDMHDAGPLAWTPDGKSILFSTVRGDDWERSFNSEVYALDIASGDIRPLTSRDGPDGAPIISPDGTKIAYLGFDDTRRSYENTELYVMNRDGSGARSLTASLDVSIDSAVWAADGKSLIVSYEYYGIVRVGRIPLDGKAIPMAQTLAPAQLDRPYAGGSFSIAKNGTMAYTGGSTLRPADIFVLPVGGASRRLTRLNEETLGAKTLGQVQEVRTKAPDGKEIQSWLVTPPGYKPGTRVPLILEIHGGPHTAYGPWFSTDNQLYAASGYAVLYVNPRGSTSYGEDFANLIDKNYPGPDYDDLIASVDKAIEMGVADPDNLFVTGGSGGGVLTTWIVGKTKRFKAAAAQKPVINWISEALTMDMTVFTSRYWFTKLPWEDPMGYWKRSPLSVVGNITTPTLVVVGAEDYRTPVSESEQLYAALQIRRVPTALVKVPGASHGGIAARPSQSAAKAGAILAWFDKYRTKPAQ